MKQKQIDIDIAKKELRTMLRKDKAIYTVVKHVSNSGMMRYISSYIVDNKRHNKIRNIDWYVEKILDWKRAPQDKGVKVSGWGMDMGFHLVYSLSYTLFPKGHKCLGEHCFSNDHSNDRTCNKVKGKHHHNDGGYCLKQYWL